MITALLLHMRQHNSKIATKTVWYRRSAYRSRQTGGLRLPCPSWHSSRRPTPVAICSAKNEPNRTKQQGTPGLDRFFRPSVKPQTRTIPKKEQSSCSQEGQRESSNKIKTKSTERPFPEKFHLQHDQHHTLCAVPVRNATEASKGRGARRERERETHAE